MARTEPRLQVDPKTYEVIAATASARGVTKREVVEQLVRDMSDQEAVLASSQRLISTMVKHMQLTEARLGTIADFIAANWAFQHDDSSER